MSESLQTSNWLDKFLSSLRPLIFLILLSLITNSLSDESINYKERVAFETIPQSNLTQKSFYEQQYQDFETDYPKSRKKRFLYYNIESNLDVGFLVVIPITIVIPSMSNFFNGWRRKRSIPEIRDVEEEFQDHPLVQPHLDRISTYFELLDIPEHQCQLRAMCEFSADPYKFYPISELILGRLKAPSVPSNLIYTNNDANKSNETNSVTQSLFRRYTNAAEDGLALGPTACHTNYGKKCKYAMDKLLSMASLRLWKGLKSQMGFSIKDDFVL